jgi:hypothetical protein
MTMLSWSQEITINTQLGQITGMGRTNVVGNTTVYDFQNKKEINITNW